MMELTLLDHSSVSSLIESFVVSIMDVCGSRFFDGEMLSVAFTLSSDVFCIENNLCGNGDLFALPADDTENGPIYVLEKRLLVGYHFCRGY